MARSQADAALTRAIIAAFHARAQAFAPPSPTGGQLEALRSGLGRAGGRSSGIGHVHDDGYLYQRTVGADRRAGQHADAVLLFRGLTTEELRLLELKYWVPIDGHTTYQRVVASADLVERAVGEEENAPKVPMTRGGEVFLSATTSLVTTDPDGTERTGTRDGVERIEESRALVEGTKVRQTSDESIAAAMGWIEGVTLGRRGEWTTYQPPACRDENAPYYGNTLVEYCRGCGAARAIDGPGRVETHVKGCKVDAGGKKASGAVTKARKKLYGTVDEMRDAAAREEEE